MKTISIIVPIYKGNCYIEKLVNMIEENCKSLNEKQAILVELLFVNDFPDENLDIDRFHEKDIVVRKISNKTNIGIHRSRVNGLLHSKGDYIVFLDQDDAISPMYLKEQMKQLGDYDAVVCNGIEQSLPIYKSSTEYQRVLDIKSYKDGNNFIISPGQVLLRKSAIPVAWMKNILIHNGADDYYLWFLMMLSKKRFRINPKILFLHTISDNNTSNDKQQMLDSINEMLLYLSADKLLSEDEMEKILNRRKTEVTLTRYNMYQQYMYLLDLWLSLIEEGYSPVNYLLRNNMHTIAIYGMGMLGKHLERELWDADIQIKYIIDQRWQLINDKRCIPVGAHMDFIDVIIITPICEYQEIKDKLKQYYNCRMVSLSTVIKSMNVSLPESRS